MVEVVINSVEAAALQRLLLGGTLHVKKKVSFTLKTLHVYEYFSFKLYTHIQRAVFSPEALHCISQS